MGLSGKQALRMALKSLEIHSHSLCVGMPAKQAIGVVSIGAKLPRSPAGVAAKYGAGSINP